MENTTGEKMKNPTSMRLSGMTRQQIRELAQATGLNQTEIVSVSIDRMYRSEFKSKTEDKMAKKFDVFFDNGGGITLQLKRYCHHYDDPIQAADDVRQLIAGADTADWDGNDPEGRIVYDLETEMNGGYKWHDQDEVKAIVKAGNIADNYGYNMDTFYRALGVTVGEAS